MGDFIKGMLVAVWYQMDVHMCACVQCSGGRCRVRQEGLANVVHKPWVRPRDNGILNMSGWAGHRNCWRLLVNSLVLVGIGQSKRRRLLSPLSFWVTYAPPSPCLSFAFPGLEVEFVSSSLYLWSHEETELLVIAVHFPDPNVVEPQSRRFEVLLNFPVS